ncbi:hypothetical protein A9Q89_07275 [Gammaproteobacteria bacterium 53_120_T64]|nr:hypothetical protein A9Q89_07275 [Gammaproteobacteria bacterium 53_120_T64]
MPFGKDKKCVLVIDDDASLLRQIRYRLEHHEGLAVTEAMDGEQGLELAKCDNPDIIILDWMLPGMQGLEVLEYLRAMSVTQKTPVLMLTGKNKVGNIEDAFQLGAQAYLTKPFSLQKLGEKVQSLLSNSLGNG